MEIYRYVRVSSTDQNENRHLIALHEKAALGKNIYMDKHPNKDFDRHKYKKLKPDGLLYILSTDRFGHNYEEIPATMSRPHKREIDICVIDMPLLGTRQGEYLMEIFIAYLVLLISRGFHPENLMI